MKWKKRLREVVNVVSSCLGFLVGLFVTMPILAMGFQGTFVSLFSVSFALFFVWILGLCLCQKRLGFINRSSLLLLIWFGMAIASSLYGFLFFQGKSEWVAASVTYVPKILLYAIFLVVFYQVRLDAGLVAWILKGFILGAILNLLWAVVEGGVFYASGLVLNNIIFAEYMQKLPESRQFISIVSGGGLRASGLNYDPAHIGGLAPIVVLYALLRGRLILLVLAFSALIFSQSTTGLVASLLSVIFLLVTSRTSFNYKISMIGFRQCLLIFFLMLLAGFGGLAFFGLPDSLYLNASAFIERVTGIYMDGGSETARHVYNFRLLDAFSFSGFNAFLGTGFGTASYPYVYHPELSAFFDAPPRPYDPESTYISYLFDLGVFGLFLYGFIIIRGLGCYRRKLENHECLILFSGLCGIFFSGFFYHYTLTAYQVLIIILSVVSDRDYGFFYKRRGSQALS